MWFQCVGPYIVRYKEPEVLVLGDSCYRGIVTLEDPIIPFLDGVQKEAVAVIENQELKFTKTVEGLEINVCRLKLEPTAAPSMLKLIREQCALAAYWRSLAETSSSEVSALSRDLDLIVAEKETFQTDLLRRVCIILDSRRPKQEDDLDTTYEAALAKIKTEADI